MTAPNLRIAHLTDLHLTDNVRLADQAEVLDRIVQQAIDLGVQATLLTGDLYGRTVPHKSTPAERNVLYPAVAKLARLGPVVVVPGNHDFPGDLNTLAQVGGGMNWPVIVQNRPKVLKLQTPGPDLHVYVMPWPTKRMLLQGETIPKAPEESRRVAGEKLDQLLTLWGHRIRRQRQTNPGVVHCLAAHCMTVGGRTSGGEVLTGYEIEISRAAMDAMAVDYGALGHLHFRQMVADRCYFGGDPWAVDFGETDTKGWNLIDIAATRDDLQPGPDGGLYPWTSTPQPGRQVTRVTFIPTHSRKWVTLDWRWAADKEDGAPRWVTEPTPEEWDKVRDAEVRARLVVPQQWVAGCPWDQVLEKLNIAGAHRVTSNRTIEPVLRVRAPKISTAKNPMDKLQEYWSTLETTIDPADKDAATSLLADLINTDDEAIRADTDQLLTPA